MAKIKIYLDTRRANKNNEYPLKLSINHKGKSELISLGIYLKQEQWDGVLVVNHEKHKIFNQIIKNKRLSAEVEILRIMQNSDISRYTARDIKKILQNPFDEPEQENKTYSFIQHFDKFIEQCNRPRTKEVYQSTRDKIIKYSGEGITFADVTFAWLKDFEQHLKVQGLQINSISIHLRNIRAVFNDAINRELADANKYPFRRFKIQSEKTKKRALTVERLTEIRDLKCEERKEKYRDIFMLIFYLIGINTVDYA